MKKLLLFTVYCSLFTGIALGYSSLDVSNATYLADEGLIVKQSSNAQYRLDDTITRAEVVGIALKIKGITLPEKYTCKNYFSDVKYDAKNNWVCRAVEIAADNELVTRNNTKFRPGDRITKIEALAIIAKANGETEKIPDLPDLNAEEYKTMVRNASRPEYSKLGLTDWQMDLLLFTIQDCRIHLGNQCNQPQSLDGGIENIKKFKPNSYAKRSEVFGFARNIVEYGVKEAYMVDAQFTTPIQSICRNLQESHVQNASWFQENNIPIIALPTKNTYSKSYIPKNGIVTYVATQLHSPEETLSNSIYQYNCTQDTSIKISESLISGLYTNVVIKDVNDSYILAKITGGEYDLPGMSDFFVYSISMGKGISISGSSPEGIDKYVKLPRGRYSTTIEDIRFNGEKIEAMVTINDAGANYNPIDLPEYTLISEKWIGIDPTTGILQ